jgi:hypothetical protein
MSNNISRSNCETWGGFKYCVVRWANGPWCIMYICIYVTGYHRLAISNLAVLSMFISSWWLSPVLHSLVGSLLWLAYAWDHMNHIDLRNSVWIRFHCRVTALGLSTQPRVISDVIFVLMSYQRYSIFLDVNELAFDSACPRYCAYRGSSIFQTSF